MKSTTKTQPIFSWTSRLWRSPTESKFTILIIVGLLIYPLFADPFFTFQIAGYSLVLGTLALSLMVLAGYGGMVSLAQVTVAGIAGYAIAITGTNSSGLAGWGWPLWLAIPSAIFVAAICSGLIGLLAVRTNGIYTIMITLAITTAFFYFTRQNYTFFNGFDGLAGIPAPTLLGSNLHDPIPFYYLSLCVAIFFYGAAIYGARTPFGLSLMAIRDNARRAEALGYNVTIHRVVAFFLAGIIAGSAGILLAWFNTQVSPGSVNVSVAIDLLVVAVIGGLRHPIGPFLGAVLFVLLQNFAINFVSPERFNTAIGAIFVAIVMTSPDGILGLIVRARKLLIN